jgi:transposase
MKEGTTIGMDMGDKSHRICVLGEDGAVLLEKEVQNTRAAIRVCFKDYERATIAIEAGTHSGWVSRELEALGLKVLVGNARKLRAIWESDEKNDEHDAEMLARIARFDPKLLRPIYHRGEESECDLALIKARDQLVQTRTRLLLHVRSAVKGTGERLPSCSSESFHKMAGKHLPGQLKADLMPVIEVIESLTEKIRSYENKIKWLCENKYPETGYLTQVKGVGPVTALGYVLTVEDHKRFKKSRSVGAYFGLKPRLDQSGQTDKQLHITKAGNTYMRQLLVGCAHYIMGPFGEDSDLRRYGSRIASRGGKNAKKRAVVAVARKLAVLLHSLWRNQSEYEALYKGKMKRAA